MDENIGSPMVTVFMAAYNAEGFIAESISSVLNQAYRNFELVIVNDGSTDNTVKVVETFKDARIRLVHNAKNSGIFYTRSRTSELAKGKYIAILDSDDIASLDRLELQMSFMEANPQVALCGGHAEIINENGEPTGVNYIEPYDETIAATMLFSNPYINSTALFRTDVFSSLGGYRNYAPAEDFDLFSRIAAKYEVANLNKTLVKYRIHSNNTSTKDNSDQLKNESRILRNLRMDLGFSETDLFSEIHLSIYKRNYEQFEIDKYALFLFEIKKANQISKRYEQELLNQLLFNKWFEIIREKKSKRALFLLFNKMLFERKYCSLKQFRKVLKQTLFKL